MIVPKVLYYKFDFSIDPIEVVESIVKYISSKNSEKHKEEHFIKSEFIDIFKEDFNDKDKDNNIDSLIIHLSYLLKEELIKTVFTSDNSIFFVNINGGYLLTTSDKVNPNVSFYSICNILAKYIDFDFDIFTSLLSQLHTNPVIIKLIITQNKKEVKNIIYNMNDLTTNEEEETVDEESCIIKEKVIKDSYSLDIHGKEVYEVYDSSHNLLGIHIDNSFFPLTNEILLIRNSLLDITKAYLLSSISYNKPKNFIQQDELQNFLNDSQREDFLELLSKLTNNLYINFEDIVEHNEFERYFNELYLVRGLKNLEDFHYFVNSDKTNREGTQARKILLGIYTDPKIGTEYNLLHWITLDIRANSINDYSGKSIPIKIPEIQKVWALNQACSYYFISDFFEDFFEIQLKKAGIKYKRNISITYSNGKSREIDFLLFLSNKITAIECKTRLDKYNVEDTIQKTEILYREIPTELDKDHIEFMMFSLFYNENIRDHFSPFIQEPVGAKTINFQFKLPCGKKMRCISSRENCKIKEILRKL